MICSGPFFPRSFSQWRECFCDRDQNLFVPQMIPLTPTAPVEMKRFILMFNLFGFTYWSRDRRAGYGLSHRSARWWSRRQTVCRYLVRYCIIQLLHSWLTDRCYFVYNWRIKLGNVKIEWNLILKWIRSVLSLM